MRRWLAAAALVACSALQGGCYLVHVASGQAEVSSRTEPIERVIASPATEPELRARLEYVTRAREFAVRELGLPDNDTYRRYADVGRPYVTWNVFAAPEFSVSPKTWCFPIAGCVAYRGYFDERKARDYAAGLARRGYDTWVSGVPAYSTLGHLRDPVLSTMMRYGDVELAAMLFHELAHQVVYVPGDSAFNEAYASVVEFEGTRRWLQALGRGEELDAFLSRRQRYFAVADLLVAARGRLAAVYAAQLADADRRRRKAEEFDRLKREYAALKAGWGGDAGLDGWVGGDVNNARLVAVATYHQCVPGFERLLESAGHDLPRFHEAVKALARQPASERARAVCAATSD
jgi:predicted aminopeptidase